MPAIPACPKCRTEMRQLGPHLYLCMEHREVWLSCPRCFHRMTPGDEVYICRGCGLLIRLDTEVVAQRAAAA